MLLGLKELHLLDLGLFFSVGLQFVHVNGESSS